ncbi:MAG: asparagine synthase (glutamine-hydrolyzing) [Nitrospirae bacterium]|nr:asparagine synthase (glutamine-hydrolyzing) [Nitrospirota bacterium]
MCGIAGFISKNKKYNAYEIVNNMLCKMRYRGPDQIGLKTFGNVTLGMTRLSIIGKSKHTIPYEDSSGSYVIVYNGEIYNHNSIKDSLIFSYKFKTDSDAETALYNYIEKGTDSFKDYNGMYAFAVCDAQGKNVYIVRDKAGEKPIYYVKGKDFFAFASEMKSLLEVVSPEFNRNAISYRAYEFTVGSETLFKNIYSLEPGEYIKANDKGFTKHEYWKIWDNLIDIQDNEKKIIKDLSELLEDAILLRTKNSVHQYGCFISGGVDSSLVACISKPDFIYHVHYDYDDFDELEYAQLIAKRIKRELKVIKPDKKDFIRTRDQIAYHLDTPCTWTSFSLWMLLEHSCRDLKVVMNGDGADEIFSGYSRYMLLYHDEQIKQLESMSKYAYLVGRYYGSPVDRYAKLVNRCENQFDEQVNRYLDQTISYYFEKTRADVIHAMGLNDFYSTMQVLLQMADRLCMAFSIENRSPFLDYRLIQYAFSMPSKYKIRNGVTKWALKKVARKFIPREIVDRIDKRGFSAPVNRWFEWDRTGKYNRSVYKSMAFEYWKKMFRVKNG